MTKNILVILVAILAGCSAPAPTQKAEPIHVNATHVSRIAFQGVHYSLKKGQVIGKYYWGRDEIGKSLVWNNQRKSDEFNKQVNSVFERYGYPVLRFDRNLHGAGKSSRSDMNVSLEITAINIDQRKSRSIENQSHSVELKGIFRVFSDALETETYEQSIAAFAKDTPQPGGKHLDAMPLAIEKLVIKLLSDESFVAFVRRRDL